MMKNNDRNPGHGKSGINIMVEHYSYQDAANVYLCDQSASEGDFKQGSHGRNGIVSAIALAYLPSSVVKLTLRKLTQAELRQNELYQKIASSNNSLEEAA
jgi:hypothetical protein